MRGLRTWPRHGTVPMIRNRRIRPRLAVRMRCRCARGAKERKRLVVEEQQTEVVDDTGKALQSLAKCEPMSPVPIMRAVLPSGVMARSASCHVALVLLAAQMCRFFMMAHIMANMCSETLCPYAPVALVSMDPGCRMPGRWYLSTPALQVCNHSSVGHCRHVPGSALPMMAVTCALISSGMMAVHAMLPHCAGSPTNSCGTPLAARTNCACSDGVNGRQLTISLRLFSVPPIPP